MDADTFFSLLSNREYLPAVGLALVALVATLRAGLPRLSPWFGTTLGGHAIGFGASTLVHVGVALQTGVGITPGLFASALGVGWASSGGWEAVRDFWLWNKGRKVDSSEKAIAAARALIASVDAAAEKAKAASVPATLPATPADDKTAKITTPADDKTAKITTPADAKTSGGVS